MTKAKIYYHDIGDYLSREEKLNIVQKFGSMANMPWQELTPNEHGDWISMRNESFDTFIPLAPEKKFDLKTESFFNTYAIGVATNRDAWVYNFSEKAIRENMTKMIDFYNEQTQNFATAKQQNSNLTVEDFIDTNPEKISWTVNLKNDVSKNKSHILNEEEIKVGTYRPFTKQKIYFDRPFIERPGLSAVLLPKKNSENLIISITGVGASKPFSVLIGNTVPNLDNIEKSQCFPLYFYEENTSAQTGLFDEAGAGDYIRRDAISDFILNRAKQQYNTKDISKEDIFYYVYGFLHSKDYRDTFANDLKKMLPRLPLVEDVRDFWAFSKAGRQLADLHLNYESVPAHPALEVTGGNSPFGGSQWEDYSFYRVEKMRFPTGLKAKDRPDTILYNNKITVSNIPEKAYDYIVNGKSAIEWIMERYAITTHKDSGITNDPNDWAEEVGNPRYVLDLLLSVVNVSVQTAEIVKGLPKIKFD